MLELETRTGGVGWPNAVRTIAYVEALEHYRARVRPMVIGVLAGLVPSCRALHKGELTQLDAGSLLEAIGLSDDADFHAQLFAAAFDSETRANAFGEAEDRLKDYVEKTAEALAKDEL